MILLSKQVGRFRSRKSDTDHHIVRLENTDCVVWFESGDRTFTLAEIVGLLGYEPKFSERPPTSDRQPTANPPSTGSGSAPNPLPVPRTERSA